MSESTREVRPLTGLRGIAALDVVISHYGAYKIPALQPLVLNNAAVDVFFCLSSFTLCLVYRAGLADRLDLRGYLAARFARIYPLYFAATLLMLAAGLRWREHYFGHEKPWLLARQFWHQALMLGAWPVPALSGFWNPPAWSISAEVFCYLLVFPLLFALARPARPLPAAVLAGGALLAAGASVAMYVLHYNSTVNEIGFPPPDDALAYWTALVRAVTMAVAGWLAYLLWLQRGAVAHLAGRATDAAAAGVLVLAAVAVLTGFSTQIVVLLAPVLILGLMRADSLVARWLASPGLHFLGEISYAVYLLHWPVAMIARHVLGFATRGTVLSILVPLALTLLAAAASTYWFERPARRWLRQRLGVRRAVTMR